MNSATIETETIYKFSSYIQQCYDSETVCHSAKHDKEGLRERQEASGNRSGRLVWSVFRGRRGGSQDLNLILQV